MMIQVLSIYNEFECSCADCRMDCCSGWRIPIDEEARKRFLESQKAEGYKLRLSMKKRDGIWMFNPESGRCPFHNRKGLCSLQLAHGQDFIPAICRRFPRNFINYGEHAEAFLDLTCYHAACMVIDNCSSMTMVEADESQFSPEEQRLLATAGTCSGDDQSFTEDLFEARSRWTESLRSIDPGAAEKAADLISVDGDFDRAICSLVGFCREGQEELARGNRLSLVTQKYFADGHEEINMAAERSLAPFPITLLHEMLSSSFMQPQLERTSPFLFELCDLFFDTYAGMYEQAASMRYVSLVERLITEEPHVFEEFRGFIVYILYTEFMMSYNDYSLLRHILIGLIEASLILLFEALLYGRDGRTDRETRARVIAAVLRRIRHNEDVRDELLRIVRRYLA